MSDLDRLVFVTSLQLSQQVFLFFSFSTSVEDVTVYLPLVMPVLVARLGDLEMMEPSEELRLTCVTYLTSVVDICASEMTPYLSDVVTILQRTLVDPYPEVKKVWLKK